MKNTETIIENIAIVKEQAAQEEAREAVEAAGFLKFVDVDRDSIADDYGEAMVNAFRIMDPYMEPYNADEMRPFFKPYVKPAEWTDVRDYKFENDFTYGDLGREVYYMMQDGTYYDLFSGKLSMTGRDEWRWLVSVHNAVADMIHATLYGGTQDRYTYIIAGDDGPTFATLSEARKYQERTGTALTAHTWTTNIQFLANHTED